jgi:hypothetical protein
MAPSQAYCVVVYLKHDVSDLELAHECGFRFLAHLRDILQ